MDWSSIAFSLFGILIGIAVSWYFFRQGQVTDFGSLKTEITNYQQDSTRQSLRKIESAILDIAHIQRTLEKQGDTLHSIESSIPNERNILSQLGTQQRSLQEIVSSISDTHSISVQMESHGEILDRLSGTIAVLGTAAVLEEKVDIFKELVGIRASLDSMNKDVNSLTTTITGEVGKQQQYMIGNIEEKFTIEIEKSRAILSESIERELSSFTSRSGDTEVMVQRLLDLVENSLNSMGQFQRMSMLDGSTAVLEKVERSISKPIYTVSNDVQELRIRIDDLTASLPDVYKQLPG